MFTKKSNSRMFTVLIIVIFMLTGVLPAQAESLASPRDASGDFLWAKGIGGIGLDAGYRIAVDSNGNVYTTGLFSGTVDFDPGVSIFNLTSAGSSDIFVSKLNSGGDFVWAKRMGGTGSDEGHDITVDSNGNVYIAGFFSGTADFDPSADTSNLTSAGSVDIFVSKLDSSGDFLWAKRMGGTGFDNAYRITLDSSGNVYTSGFFYATVDFDPGIGIANLTSVGSGDIFVSKLNINGDFIWAKSIGGTTNDSGFGLTVDSSNNVYATGAFSGTADFDPGISVFELTSAGGSDIFVSKMDSNGDFVWAKSMGGTSNDASDDLTVDSSGNVYTTGHFYATADFDPGTGIYNLTLAGPLDTFVSKLDNNGDFVWAKGMGGTHYVQSSSITIDSSGNIYTSGAFLETADFDPGVGVSYLTSVGGVDMFISKLNNSGSFVWAKNMGGIGDDYGYGMALDSGDRIYMTGNFKSTADFDPGAGIFNLTSVGFEDIFISKLESGVVPAPQELIVTKTADTNDGVCNADCSLREAIAAASTGDTITFDPSLAGQTTRLTSSLLIEKGLTIDGSSLASHIKISGDTDNNGTGDVSVLQISGTSPIELNGLDIVKGKGLGTSGGGGITNYGILSIKNSNISGNSHGGDISGGGIYNEGNLTIADSTLTNNSAYSSYGGSSGGAINNHEGNMIIKNCTFTENSGGEGGAVYNKAQMSILGSTFNENSTSGSGGGITNFGILTVTDSILSNNSAHVGGGIFNSGDLTITNTNISGNSAIGGVGGIMNDNNGTLTITNSVISNNTSSCCHGGILNANGTVDISNSTVSGNSAPSSASAPGGGISNWDTLTATNVTFSGNSAGYGGGILNLGTSYITNNTISGNSASISGGGIYNTGTLNYTNTIIANSTSGSDCFNDVIHAIPNIPNIINTNIHNLVEDGSCSASMSGDPKLGPLADNDGPTYTMALLSSSPAINAGDNDTCETTDQRGISRPQGAHCDIGAFEYKPPVIYHVKWSASGTNDGTSWTNAYTDLQSALLAASNGDEIWVAAGTYKPTMGTDRTVSFVLKNGVAIYGGFAGTETMHIQRNPSANVTILSGEIGAAGIADNSYHVVDGGGTNNTAILDGFTITKGNADDLFDPHAWGGGMHILEGSPSLTNLIFTANTAKVGGGIALDNSKSILLNVTFNGNSADFAGGGMAVIADSPTLRNVTFNGNFAESGGGMSNSNASPILENVTFNGNNASTSGGGMYNGLSDSTLKNVTFSGNIAPAGGGMTNETSNPTVTNSILWENTGGEIENILGSSPVVTYSIVQGGYLGTGNLNSNPLLGSLANNGGFTQTMAIGAGSPAINAGNDGACTATDQRGVARPQGPHCDIGAFEVDSTMPIVNSITLASANPTSAASVDFTITFSEPVSGVNPTTPFDDFALTTSSGISGASITGVSGSGATYSVTINTGSGSGTIRLDVVDDNSIVDAASNPLGGVAIGDGNFTTGDVYTITKSASIEVYIGGVNQGNYPLVSGESMVKKYALDGGPVVISSNNGTDIVASLNQWRRRPSTTVGWTGVSQSMALPVELITNQYVMPRYDYSNTTALYNALLLANVDTVSRDITVKIGGTVKGTYTIGASQSQFVTYGGVVGGPVVVSSVSGAKIVASLYELIRDPSLPGWNGQSEMMGIPLSQLSDKYIIPIYFGAANPITLNAKLFIANADTIGTTIEIKIAGISRGTYALQPNTGQVVAYNIDGGPVEISSNNGAKIVASLNQWRRRPSTKVGWTGVSQSMALPLELITDQYVMPRYDYSNTTALYNALLLANVDTVSRDITVKIGGTVKGTYTIGASQSQFVTYGGVVGGPVVVSSVSGAKIVASLYELIRDPSLPGWNGQSEMMGIPLSQLSDKYIIPIYFGAANPITLNAKLYIGVP